jgi:hypothetical protein
MNGGQVGVDIDQHDNIQLTFGEPSKTAKETAATTH